MPRSRSRLFAELHARRVLPYIGAYILAAWGLVQFMSFLEERFQLSPHLVNIVMAGVLLLLPSAALLAWRHGRPGADSWGRVERLTLPLNLIATVLVLVLLFHGKELGAVTTMVQVEDENGEISERRVPREAFRRRLILYAWEDRGSRPEDDWLVEGLPFLLSMDLNQDLFLDATHSLELASRLLAMDRHSVRGLDRVLQRKLARESHHDYFLTGAFKRSDQGISIDLELYHSNQGRRIASRHLEGADLFTLIDELTPLLRGDLGLPEWQVGNREDLPVDELMSSSLPAIELFLSAINGIFMNNDWAGAQAPLEEAVAMDPGFAISHFMLYAVYNALGEVELSHQASERTMANLYRIPERSQFMVKAQIYYNEEADADRALAVCRMWSQLYPEDIEARRQIAMFLALRNDWDGVIAEYEEILSIDPSQWDLLTEIGKTHRRRGDYELAEAALLKYEEHFPEDPQAAIALAECRESQGDLAGARVGFERAQMLDPALVKVGRRLARVEMKLGETEAAFERLTGLTVGAKAPRERAAVIKQLLELEVRRGRIGRAQTVFEDWLRTANQAYSQSERMGGIISIMDPLSENGKAGYILSKVDEFETEIISILHPLLGIGRIRAELELGHPEAAEMALARADSFVATYKMEILRPLLLEHDGRILEYRELWPEALAVYKRGRELQPNDMAYLQGIARCRTVMGDNEAAIQVFEEAMVLDPAEPWINLALARLHAKAGRTGRAREHLGKAQEIWEAADLDFKPAVEAKAFAISLNPGD